MTVIGMGVVFSVLALLCIMLIFTNKLFDYFEAKKQAAGEPAEKERPVSLAEKSATVNPEPVQQETVPDMEATPANPGLNPKTVAAIMAAVSVYVGQPAEKFRLTAVRHLSTAAGQGMVWASAGRQELILARQEILNRKGSRKR
ncbi:sodium pump decarboxylase subunit gamma [Calderihabitans maritimus]|uniref:Sodium pump decarboxylase subunit gamma n=2 Tax=Calderihabitans maritimus TaxID=1246530 RepID=A0A1Z5HXJ4_9FIRM|nr:sodium pump decarboxylase subunit gamma [Calderihabitans maritimus]